MNMLGEDHYFPMIGMGGGPGPAMSRDCDSTKIGLGLHSGSPEPFPSFVPGDFASLRVPEQSDDRRSYYAPSICTQPSLGQDAPQRAPSVSDSTEDCLNFLPPVSPYTLLDEWSQPVDILLSAQLAGLFSRETQVLEGTMPDENSIAPESMNLICYRRNLISITGHVAIPAKLRLLENAQGQQVPIISQEIVLSVFESLERGRGGRLIQSLRSGPPISAAAEADSDSPGPEPISLDPEKAEDGSQDQEYVIFPFEWQRLQFRKATPNNGKSRDRQKYFFVSIKVLANLADGQKVSISEASSNPIVVRGRGPQNFVAKDSQKLGRSRSLNSTSEGRLKKPNRHATRNSLLRQSLSRKTRADSTTTSSDALQRMSIEDLSALFQDTTSADVRPFTATHGPLNDLDVERTGRRTSPTATPPPAALAYMNSLRASSIPPRFDMNGRVMQIGAESINTEALGFSPDGFSETSPSTQYPNVSSVSPQDLEKRNNRNFGYPLSPPRSEGFRSSSVDTERRYRSPFEVNSSIPRSESHTNIFRAAKGDGDMTMDQLPMSPPEDDFVNRRSVSVSATNTTLTDGQAMEEKMNHFPMSPLSPPKESELAGGASNPPSAINVTDSDKPSDPTSAFGADPLPSPRTQMEIFDRILTPFPPYQGVDSWQVSDIMTPIKEQAEPRPLTNGIEHSQSIVMPSISEPNEPQNFLSFTEQLDSKPFSPSDSIEIISIPPPSDPMDTEVLPSTETFVAN